MTHCPLPLQCTLIPVQLTCCIRYLLQVAWEHWRQKAGGAILKAWQQASQRSAWAAESAASAFQAFAGAQQQEEGRLVLQAWLLAARVQHAWTCLGSTAGSQHRRQLQLRALLGCALAASQGYVMLQDGLTLILFHCKSMLTVSVGTNCAGLPAAKPFPFRALCPA